MPRFWRGVAAVLLVLAWSGGTLAQAPVLPPLVSMANRVQTPGKFVFAQLVVPDLAAAEHFYGALFGWSFRKLPSQALPYAAATLDGEMVAGLAQVPLPSDGRRPDWLSFFATTDADATVRLAVQQGGRVLSPARDVPDLGREAVLADPQGAVFAILQSGSGDPADVLRDDGSWIWTSLITSAPDPAAAFYQALFDYFVYEVSGTSEEGHLLLASRGYARGSINPFPGPPAGRHPHWLSYVRVSDAAATTRQAVALGGRVLVEPYPDRDGNMVAVIADPQGAALGLLQWSAAAEPDQ